MKKANSKAITLVLLATIAIAFIPIVAAVDIENIAIEQANPPSPIGLQVPVGQPLNLSFANVTILGAQFQLYISSDGLAAINPADKVIGPRSGLFDTANLTASTASIYPGGFVVGWNYVNITMPATLPDGTQLPGGRYYIKMWDGNPADTVVTDTFFYLLGGVSLTPTWGPAYAALNMTGSAFLPNDFVNVTATLGPRYDLNPTDANGVFSLPNTVNPTFIAPDTGAEIPAGVQPNSTGFQVITYTATQQSTGISAPPVTFTEYARGWKRVGSANLLSSSNVYGNNTDLTATVSMAVASSQTIAGQYFRPGTVSLFLDNTIALGTATAGATGSFSVSVTIPNIPVGVHTIQARDAGATLNVSITVIPTLILRDTTNNAVGPVGEPVQVTGLGLPASTNLYIYWFERSLGSGTYHWLMNVTTTADGQINPGVNFTVAHAYGGAHPVNAYATYSGTSTSTPGTVVAGASYTVTATFTVPSSLNNTGQKIDAIGTGFPVGEGSTFIPNIDNNYLGIDTFGSVYATSVQAASNGDLTFQFVDAGFSPGTHVVSLYLIGQTSVSQMSLFTVASQTIADTSTTLLNAINQTVTQTNSTVNGIQVDLAGMNATLVSINGTVATIQTNVGTIQTSLTSLGTTITSISNGMATLQTSMGTVTTSVNNLVGQIGGISSISSGVAAIQTTLGTVTSSLSNINAKLATIEGNTVTIITDVGNVSATLADIGATVTDITDGVATIQTDLGTLSGTVDSIEGDVATITTSLGTIQADISALQTGLTSVQEDVTSAKNTSESLSPLIIVAIVLALVAAVAAIASIVLVRRKIAG